MTQEHPITPPPELVKQWLGTYFGATVTGEVSDVELALVNQAARWGADMELEACCEWLHSSLPGYDKHYADYLRAARRPKPPSLKEQALDAFAGATFCTPEDKEIILRALESLPD